MNNSALIDISIVQFVETARCDNILSRNCVTNTGISTNVFQQFGVAFLLLLMGVWDGAGVFCHRC